MTNKDMIIAAIVVGFLIFIWTVQQRHPANHILDTAPPLPINLKTNGVANGNTNDVANRVNFRLQPNG